MAFFINSLRIWLSDASGDFHRLHRILPPTSNARVLISRNKREGGYIGWRTVHQEYRYRKTWGHQRAGMNAFALTLKRTARLWREL